MNLIIVESPKKAKTIEGYLGKDYKVLGSGGHIRELPEKEFGIDVNNGFKPKYVISDNSVKTVKELNAAAKKADLVYLATDPDREGEAIAWHLYDVLDIKKKSYRIKFNEISKKAITKSLQEPGRIDYHLVDSQQARRVLDRLVGYKLSPFVRKRVEDGESAGRVQSVAVRLIVELERKILSFVPEEYWTIKAITNTKTEEELVLNLDTKVGKKYKPQNEQEALDVYNNVIHKYLQVVGVKSSVVKSHALPPFTTSTMQQDGTIKLNLSSPQIMQLAQHLYEGIETKEGHIAFVTYIRTDSTRVSVDAQQDALAFIESHFGKEYVPSKPNIYATGKNAQDAHEAIRPTNIEMTPEKAKTLLDKNHFALYKLIYERYVASQMADALYDQVTINATCGEYGFKAVGKVIKFKGYTAVYNYENKKDDEEETNKLLPKVDEGDELYCKDVTKEQKFTKPPVRFTDSSLVKTMEEKGIGRPSTYATIIGTLVNRKYVVRDKKYLVPTEIAFKATDVLVKYFPDILDVGFTADMETKLDDVAEDKANWVDVVQDFYTPFTKELKDADNDTEETNVPCEICGKNLVKKFGKFGPYLYCDTCNQAASKIQLLEKTEKVCEVCGSLLLKGNGKFGEYFYCPECKKYTSTSEMISEVACVKCNTLLVSKEGKFGKYLECPECGFIMHEGDELTKEKCATCGGVLLKTKGKYGAYLKCIDCGKNQTLAVEKGICPLCHKPTREMKSKAGKIFYGCSGFPNCKFMSWDIPTGDLCPICNNALVKGKDGQVICSNCKR